MANREILLDLIACVTGDEKGEFLPLDDSYENLQAFYREKVHEKLNELNKSTDLSGYTFEPSNTFFICDGLVDMHPFSKKDIDILLETKVNPYTDKKFSEEGLYNLQKIKEYFRGEFSNWGGLLELLESLDGNKELDRKDIELLKKKIIKIENTKSSHKLCDIIQSLGSPTDGELAYLNSPVLDGLYMWCTIGDIDNLIAMQMLVEKGVQFSLSMSAAVGHIHTVEILLKNGAEKKEIDKAFLSASRNGHTNIVKLLIENGADASNEQALRNAVEYGHAEVVEILLESVKNHYTSLELAIKNGHQKIIKLILERPMTREILNSRLIGMSGHGTPGIVKFLLEKGADIHTQNDAPLQQACFYGNTDIVRILLENGANVNADNGVSLQIVCGNESVEIVEMLLEHGAQTHFNNNEAMRIAVRRGNRKIINLLRAAGSPNVPYSRAIDSDSSSDSDDD